MLIKDILSGCSEEGKIPFSFEFFPPKTDKGWDGLFSTISELLPLNPAYVSVTYGAGGSTRENTHRLVTRLTRETGLTVAAHLTCEGSSKEEVGRVLDNYRADGVANVLALKGDVPREGRGASDFAFAADLIRFIRERQPGFGIGVAGFPEGHPATPNRLKEMEYLKAKVDAGADYIVTQLFFDNRDFYDFRERCELAGIRVPIIAGIMPVTTRQGMLRMAELAAGARFPARLQKAVARAETDDQVARVGVQWACEQISDLLSARVAGIHLYTLNNSRSSIEICNSLGLSRFSVRSF
jgi:methylenetetrahydrofolate reductase (NADPH)